MSQYQGIFVVINNTGHPISNVIVTHATTGFGPNTFTATTLLDSTPSAAMALVTSTPNKDRWTVAFVMQGQAFTGYVNCGFESSDNGGVVRVVLDAESFDIDMPVSSSCTDNDYQQN